MRIARSLGGGYLNDSNLFKKLEGNVFEIIGEDNLNPVIEHSQDILKNGLNALEKLFR